MTAKATDRNCCPDLKRIFERVEEKAASYDRYNFNRSQNHMLKAFFDLAQEFDSLADFYRVCVTVPLAIGGFHCRLYRYLDREGRLELVCDSRLGCLDPPQPAPDEIRINHEPYCLDQRYLVPVAAKPHIQPLSLEGGGADGEAPPPRQTHLWCTPEGVCSQHRILGMLEVHPLAALDEPDRFFFVKYGGRIGYNLHNRLLAQQNIDHLKFINSLVVDIEHNIIVPNMYFRHLFNQLKKKISELEALKAEIQSAAASREGGDCQVCLGHCQQLRADLLRYHDELVKHHANISLFLESLFRREHFQKGHLVLRPKRCFVEQEIILPQLEHYASRLRAAGIRVEHPRDMRETEFQILVDVGLLAQVYANLFSNAAKYTQEIVTSDGRRRKAMAYGWELVDDFPEPGKQGVKFNVFTTGPHLPPEERAQLFTEGMRGRNSAGIAGTGHGLAFIRHVVELHGGRVGYEQTPEGNNFYFILPLPPAEYTVMRRD